MYVTLSKISDNYTHATREKQFLVNIVVKKKNSSKCHPRHYNANKTTWHWLRLRGHFK